MSFVTLKKKKIIFLIIKIKLYTFKIIQFHCNLQMIIQYQKI